MKKDSNVKVLTVNRDNSVESINGKILSVKGKRYHTIKMIIKKRKYEVTVIVNTDRPDIVYYS